MWRRRWSRRRVTAAIAASHSQLGRLHASAGRLDQARDSYDSYLDSCSVLGDDHPETLTALQHRAFLLRELGGFEGAEAGFRESLVRRRRVFGDGHPLVAWAEDDLGWLLYGQLRGGSVPACWCSSSRSLPSRLFVSPGAWRWATASRSHQGPSPVSSWLRS